jgi:hypothetical protein
MVNSFSSKDVLFLEKMHGKAAVQGTLDFKIL